MGKSKHNKKDKNAQVLHLVYESTEDGEGSSHDRLPGMTLVPFEEIQGSLPGTHRYSSHQFSDKKSTSTYNDSVSVTSSYGSRAKAVPRGIMLSDWLDDSENRDLTDDERREILELGLPDDGYNYLKHIRRSKRKQKLNTVHENVVEDNKVIDAVNLPVITAVENEKEAFDSMRTKTISAFSKTVDFVKRSRMREIEKLEQFETEFEVYDKEGDLQDDFVLEAMKSNDTGTLISDKDPKDIQFAYPDDIEEEEEELLYDIKSRLPVSKKSARSRFSRFSKYKGTDYDETMSTFSERWKGTTASDLENRSVRSSHLEILDMQFEENIDTYDDREVGGLQCQAEEIDGEIDIMELCQELDKIKTSNIKLEYEKLLAEIDEKNKLKDALGKDYSMMQNKEDLNSWRKLDRAAARKTKELIRLAQFKGNGKIKLKIKIKIGKDIGREEWEEVYLRVKKREDRMDCESILSRITKSSTYRPGTITCNKDRNEIDKEIIKNKNELGIIQISNKTGLPLDELKKGLLNGKLTEGKLILDTTTNYEDNHSCILSKNSDNNTLMKRNKDESLDEKKERKAAIKAQRKEARANKKELKLLYKKEKNLRQKQFANTEIKNASTIAY